MNEITFWSSKRSPTLGYDCPSDEKNRGTLAIRPENVKIRSLSSHWSSSIKDYFHESLCSVPVPQCPPTTAIQSRRPIESKTIVLELLSRRPLRQ